MSGFESFVGVNPWTALFTFCNMLITFGVLAKFLFNPVKKMIDDRQKEIDDLYADAEGAKQKAHALEADYEAKLQNAKAERDAILKDAADRATKRGEELIAEARADAAAVRAAAQADAAREKQRAVQELKQEIGGMAVELATQVVQREIDAKDHRKLIDEFIEKVGEAS